MKLDQAAVRLVPAETYVLLAVAPAAELARTLGDMVGVGLEAVLGITGLVLTVVVFRQLREVSDVLDAVASGRGTGPADADGGRRAPDPGRHSA